MKKILIALILLPALQLCAQQQGSKYPYQQYFEEAYLLHPDIPRGVLEAVAYTNTHIRHINPVVEEKSCAGIPSFYGVMGLVLDGKGYFRENLKTVSGLSGYGIDDITGTPRINILAYASAYQAMLNTQKDKSDLPLSISKVLISLSELNTTATPLAGDFTMNLYMYGIFYFLNDKSNQEKYNFPDYSINLEAFFGRENLKIFTSKQINVSENKVTDNEGKSYQAVYLSGPCPDYPHSNCTWIPSTNHYTGWNGHVLSSITMHTVQGSYVSCINWFLNTSSYACTHYVVASNSAYAGQIVQMINEYNAGWHVGSENWYAIGYEHEGFVDDPTWYTKTMYQASAALTRDIASRHGINTIETFFRDTLDDGTVLDYGLHSLGGEGTCIKIKGHQHYPNQTHTDPGPYWKWDYYYKLINYATPVTTYTTPTGTFYDTGGSTGNYGNDERKFWLIKPDGAQSITLTFTQFIVESNYDFMYIYNGTNEFAPLIGRYNTTAPVTITSTGGALFIEFRTDCSVTYSGWAATWTSSMTDAGDPVASITSLPHWVNNDFTASFTDIDNNPGGTGNTGNGSTGVSGVKKKFYQVMDYNGTEWRANQQNGFLNDNFTATLNPAWTVNTGGGTWTINSGTLYQSDSVNANTNIYTSLVQNDNSEYMYQWSANMSGSTTNRSCGLYFFAGDATLPNRGNAYYVKFCADEDKVQLFRVSGDISYKKADNPIIINDNTWYDFKVIYDPGYGEIKVYINDVIAAEWIDPAPIMSGNYLSLSSSNCKVSVDNMKVRKSRTSEALVTVGNLPVKDVRYQSPSATLPSCRINTIVLDAADNWSLQKAGDVKVDWIKPITSISSLPEWISVDFTATFNDSDTLSGVANSFYQVSNLNNGIWGANTSRGYLTDNFDVFDTTVWKSPANSGTWSFNGNSVQQTDENINNSNIYTTLNQNLSNVYLYQFSAKVEGTNTNRRFGLYFSADSASLTDRGNSYFIWFNVDAQTLEFFKVTNNVFGSAKKTIGNIKVNPDQWYDFKISFDKASGNIDVYKNDTLVGNWRDYTPFINGKYISFRSCNTKLSLEEVNVYRSRVNTADITVGASPTNDIRFQNPNPSTSAAKLINRYRQRLQYISCL